MSEDIANLKIDLHCHTNCSDGDDTPFDLIRNASLKEIKVIGLSDHDNVKALDIAYEATRQFDVKLVAAIEISTPKKIHIQGLGIDPQNEALQELIVSQKKKRSDSLMKIEQKKCLTERLPLTSSVYVNICQEAVIRSLPEEILQNFTVNCLMVIRKSVVFP